jgi:hypothetical protein
MLSGCCGQSPPIKPVPASQRRSSVQNRGDVGKGSGRTSRKPSTEDLSGRNEDKPARTEPPAKSRIRLLEERCESLLKETAKIGRKLSADESPRSLPKPAFGSEVSSNNIVESIAACVDKYTGKNQVQSVY